jgi:hypothetical protein
VTITGARLANLSAGLPVCAADTDATSAEAASTATAIDSSRRIRPQDMAAKCNSYS